MTKSKIILDIETKPRERDKTLQALLDYKMRNIVDVKEREAKEISYTFRNPIYTQVVCIGTLYVNAVEEVKEKVFFSKDNEEEVINSFMTYISKFTGLFVHFNGLDFDVPILLAKSAIYGIQPPQRFCNTIRFRSDPHYDIMQIFTNWGRFGNSLEELLITFGIKNSKELLEGKNVLEFMKTRSNEDIVKYCMEDVRSTYELYKKISKVYQ